MTDLCICGEPGLHPIWRESEQAMGWCCPPCLTKLQQRPKGDFLDQLRRHVPELRVHWDDMPACRRTNMIRMVGQVGVPQHKGQPDYHKEHKDGRTTHYECSCGWRSRVRWQPRAWDKGRWTYHSIELLSAGWDTPNANGDRFGPSVLRDLWGPYLTTHDEFVARVPAEKKAALAAGFKALLKKPMSLGVPAHIMGVDKAKGPDHTAIQFLPARIVEAPFHDHCLGVVCKRCDEAFCEDDMADKDHCPLCSLDVIDEAVSIEMHMKKGHSERCAKRMVLGCQESGECEGSIRIPDGPITARIAGAPIAGTNPTITSPHVHILDQGKTLCSFNALPPSGWPENHRWVSPAEADQATCIGCCEALEFLPDSAFKLEK